jgi:hypothetical protein
MKKLYGENEALESSLFTFKISKGELKKNLQLIPLMSRFFSPQKQIRSQCSHAERLDEQFEHG